MNTRSSNQVAVPLVIDGETKDMQEALDAHIKASRTVFARRAEELHAVGLPATLQEMCSSKKSPAAMTVNGKRNKK